MTNAERCRRYYRQNRERILEQRRAEYQENREAMRERRQRHYEANRERYIKNAARWATDNPERRAEIVRKHDRTPGARARHAANQARRRARQRNAKVELVEGWKLFLRDGGICGICLGEIDGYFEIDHIVPVARGGDHTAANCQVAHRTCNRRKGAT